MPGKLTKSDSVALGWISFGCECMSRKCEKFHLSCRYIKEVLPRQPSLLVASNYMYWLGDWCVTRHETVSLVTRHETFPPCVNAAQIQGYASVHIDRWSPWQRAVWSAECMTYVQLSLCEQTWPNDRRWSTFQRHLLCDGSLMNFPFALFYLNNIFTLCHNCHYARPCKA